MNEKKIRFEKEKDESHSEKKKLKKKITYGKSTYNEWKQIGKPRRLNPKGTRYPSRKIRRFKPKSMCKRNL